MNIFAMQIPSNYEVFSIENVVGFLERDEIIESFKYKCSEDESSGSIDQCLGDLPSYEIDTTSNSNVVILGKMVSLTPYDDNTNWLEADFRCQFDTMSLETDTNILKSTTPYKNPLYDIGGNPSVTYDPISKTFFRVCMSVNLDYQGGVIEVSSSQDEGETWSDWTIVTKFDGSGIPDKPWIRAVSGEVFVAYTDITIDENHGIKSTAGLIKLGKGNNPQKVIVSDKIKNPVGASVGNSKNDTVVTYGTYQGEVFFTNLKTQELVKLPIAYDEGPIITNISQSGLFLTVTTSNPHSYGEAYMIQSSDGGESWGSPILITKNGHSLISSTDKEGRVTLLYNEKIGQSIKTITQKSNIKKDIVTSDALSEAAYLGGYQSILTIDGNDNFFFYIHPKLNSCVKLYKD